MGSRVDRGLARRAGVLLAVLAIVLTAAAAPSAATSAPPDASASPVASATPLPSASPGASEAPSASPSGASTPSAASATPTPTKPAATRQPSATGTSKPAATPSTPGKTSVKPMLAVTPNAALAPTFADGHFVDQAVWSGLIQPASVRFASDGRAFVAQKNGVVKEFDSLGDQTATWVIDLQGQVDNFWDRGLLSIALDPNFLTGSPYIYLYIVYDAPLFDLGANYGTTAPIWNDSCPAQPGSTTDGCVVSSEVLRVQVDPATNVQVGGIHAQPQILVHDWCQQFPSHSGGAMVFDSSGNLIVTGGDGASFSGQDYGQRGGTLTAPGSLITPANPCNDPPTGVGTATTVPTAEGGSLRAQQVRVSDLRPGMKTTLDGTVIRVNPTTGAGVPSNPLASSSDTNNQRIMANGFRNPFRMTSRPGTDELYVGDVGDQTWEEIDMVLPPNGPLTPTTIPNFGWPCYEGPNIDSAWQSLGTNLCNNLYAQGAGAITQPVYAYSHYNSNNPDGPCFVGDANGKMSSSISGLAFYQGASGGSIAYPAKYTGALFFTDYSRNCLAVLLANPVTGRPDPGTMEQIASNLSHPVDLVTGAGGDLFYVDMDGGIVHRISYHTDPVASAAYTPTVFLGPGVAHLDGSASTSGDPDPNNAITSWNWYLHGQSDTSGDPDATGQTYDWSVPSAGIFPVRLKVVTGFGFEASTIINVDASDTPPVPVIDTPLASVKWSVGDQISFTGHATDAEDGDLAPTQLAWELVIHHCPAGLDICHLHFIETWPDGPGGVASGSFIAPDHEYPSMLELRLTATDSHGASATTSISLDPNTATLAAGASLPDVHVFVDGAEQPNPPVPLTYIKGGLATVHAPTTAVSGGKAYRFSEWTDSPDAVHDVVLSSDTAITAQYVPDAPDTCVAATAASSVGSWITDYLSGNGDEDWFKFTLTSQRRVVMTLGSLPVDAKLELRSACGTVLATSDHTGTRFEQLVKVLNAGTYRLHVVANGGARSALPYVVRFRQLSSGVPVLSSVAARSNSTVRLAGEVMNNTAATTGKVTVTATFLNGTKTVATLKGTAFAYRLGVGGVTPFVLSGTVPTYTSIKIATTWVAPVSGPSLSVTSLTYDSGTGKEAGTIKNTGTKTARSPAISRTWYGARGEVLGAGYAIVSPSSLAPGKSGTFSLSRPASVSALQASSTGWRAIL